MADTTETTAHADADADADQPPAKRQRATDGTASIADVEKVTVTAGGADKTDEKTDAPPEAAEAETEAKPAAADATAKELLMPPTPGIPPVAPKEDRREHKAEKTKWFMSNLGKDSSEIVYCAADYALWPTVASNLFRAVKTNTDDKEASRHMRRWFADHEGMPGAVPKIPRSAFTLFQSDEKRRIFQASGSYNLKKDGKKVGAAWKKLSDDDRQPFLDKLERMKAERDANDEWHDARMVAWEEEKRQRMLL